MVRSSQDSSSTHASSPYDRLIRRVHNSENRRTPYGTEHLHSPVRRCIQQRGYPSQISFQFTGTTHIHTAMAMMDAESFSCPPADGFFVMPTHEARPRYLRTRGYPSQISNVIHSPFAGGGVQTPTAGRGSSGAGYHQRTQNAANIGPAPFLHTDVAGPEYLRDWRYPQPSGGLYNGPQMDAVRPGSVTGVQTPAVGLGPAVPGPNIGPAPIPHTDVAGPEYPRGWRYPQPSGGLYHGGLSNDTLMDAVRPGSVTGVQTPAVGLGPTGSSGVGYNQLSPIATLGFAGQTSQAPFVPEHGTQAAPPPTAANNTFAEDFLPPAVSDNFMHMLEPHFRV